jgi:hypothetical protein
MDHTSSPNVFLPLGARFARYIVAGLVCGLLALARSRAYVCILAMFDTPNCQIVVSAFG